MPLLMLNASMTKFSRLPTWASYSGVVFFLFRLALMAQSVYWKISWFSIALMKISTELNSIESQQWLVTVVSSKALREPNFSKRVLRWIVEHCLNTLLS